MRHSLNLCPDPFTRIKEGAKRIEMRLYDEKKSLIKVGDEILFTNEENGDTLLAVVTDILRFNNFEELYDSVDKKELGYLLSEEANPKDMLRYYTPERIEKYGVMGIKIELR